MEDIEELKRQPLRGACQRGRPFSPGNHYGKGRPKGSRNKKTLGGPRDLGQPWRGSSEPSFRSGGERRSANDPGAVPKRDRLGTLVKFVPPLVVARRVYVPNYDNAVNVYGLLSHFQETQPVALLAHFFKDQSWWKGLSPSRGPK